MLKLPKFANEAEEARWWFDNQDVIADEFERQKPKAEVSQAVVRLAEMRGISVEEMLTQLQAGTSAVELQSLPELPRSA
jgi:hypothetical protein